MSKSNKKKFESYENFSTENFMKFFLFQALYGIVFKLYKWNFVAEENWTKVKSF